jgi:hypothetical protein
MEKKVMNEEIITIQTTEKTITTTQEIQKEIITQTTQETTIQTTTEILETKII